jgi:hypothetical protein
MQKILLPIPSAHDEKRAKALLEAIRRRVSEGKITSHADLLTEALGALEEVYLHLTEPVTKNRILTGHRDPEAFNLFANEVLGDLIAAFSSAEQVNAGLLSSFNFTAALVSRLDNKIRKLVSRSQDLQHVTGVFTEDIITAGDSFVDNSKIDPDLNLEGDQADVLPGTGSMLHRVDIAPASDGAEVIVQSNQPIYEGKFYALEGESEPEGGRFHFANVRRGSEAPAPSRRMTIEEVMTEGVFPEGVNGSIVNSEPTESPTVGSLEMAETDDGAPLEEKQAVRTQILDGNADSYWQAEHVVNLPSMDLENLTYQDLVDALNAPGIDKIDLEVTVVLKLTIPRVVNFIVLDPLQAGDGAWMEVLDISTSIDGDEWDQLEGLHDHNFENVLTDEANEELTEEEVAVTLAPNKYEYSGKGVWTFPAREARYVRVTLLQRAPVPAPYDIKVMETSRTVTMTHTGHRGTESTNETHQRVVPMSYLDTLRTTAGSGGAPRLSAPERNEVSSGEGAIGVVRDIFDPGELFHTDKPRSQTTHEWSAEVIVDEWMETRWDKARYAIGIKDLRVFAYQFASFSERGSVAYKTPKPITKVTLLTDEVVPDDFNAGRQLRPWILYWVSFDDGVTWTPIAPTSASVLNRLDGSVLPAAVNVNSGLPEEEQDPLQAYVNVDNPRQIRLKWRLVRPEGMPDLTPVLKGYRLQLSVEGGLS